MDQTLITVLRYSITYYQKDLFICTQYANRHKATALHKAYWLPCYLNYVNRLKNNQAAESSSNYSLLNVLMTEHFPYFRRNFCCVLLALIIHVPVSVFQILLDATAFINRLHPSSNHSLQ